MYSEVTARIAEQHIADLRHEAEVHRLIARHRPGWSWSRLLHRRTSTPTRTPAPQAPAPTPARAPALRVIPGGSTSAGSR
ncbi:MAG TPA: hypothetical protein VGH85_16505 [Mycobacteriales bacterium]